MGELAVNMGLVSVLVMMLFAVRQRNRKPQNTK